LVTPTLVGVHLQEERGADRSIALLQTARAAFVGRTLRGPLNRPVLVATQVRAFFEQLHEHGAFGARRREQSYFVVCDRRFNRAKLAELCPEELRWVDALAKQLAP